MNKCSNSNCQLSKSCLRFTTPTLEVGQAVVRYEPVKKVQRTIGINDEIVLVCDNYISNE